MAKRAPPLFLFALPALLVFTAFFCLPMARLIEVSLTGKDGAGVYWTVLTSARYLHSGGDCTAVRRGHARHAGDRRDRWHLPAAPCGARQISIGGDADISAGISGVVIGFMVIMLGGRNGLLANIGDALAGERWTFAYGLTGLFVGYLYFSIPRVILTVMAAVEKLDASLEEAARSLGASPRRVVRDVMLPALMPAVLSSGRSALPPAWARLAPRSRWPRSSMYCR